MSLQGSSALFDLGLFIIDFSISHSNTPHSVRLLWISDWPVGETLPDNTHHSQETDIHAHGGIRTPSPGKRVTAGPRLRPHGY
jgi:hypothetical protein